MKYYQELLSMRGIYNAGMELIDHFTQVHLWTDGFEFQLKRL